MGLIINAIQLLFTILELAILARVLFSWIRPNPYSRFVRIIVQITDPIIQPLRRIIPPLGMLDITPLVALIGLSILQSIIVGLLAGAG
jgi:YggT family protein